MRANLFGQKFGRWTVVAPAFAKPPHFYWECRCDCGTVRNVVDQSLRSGKSTSCGCYRRENTSRNKTKHVGCDHPAYQSWVAMHRRCYDINFEGYELYGGRGIIVTPEWNGFGAFWADMGPYWKRGLTIDRIDTNGIYEPENCRWATPMQQSHNKRNNVIIPTPWGDLPQSEAARRAGISLCSLIHRMKAGWPEETWFLPSSRKK